MDAALLLDAPLTKSLTLARRVAAEPHGEERLQQHDV